MTDWVLIMSDNEPTVDIYLSRSEVSMLLVGLNFSLERHYSVYDTDLPEELINLVSRMMDLQQKFKYCYDCRSYYAVRWSSDTHECLGEEE